MTLLASPPIVLVGLPGAGKTTIGRQLATRLGLKFIDTDLMIEAGLGYSIQQCFEISGEKGFRAIEAATIRALKDSEVCVISTGGGAVLDPQSRKLLTDAFQCIYLRANPEDLLRRIKHDKKRPLLQVEHPLLTLQNLFADRDPLYLEVAQHVVDTGRPSISSVVDLISSKLTTNLAAPQKQ